MAKYLLTVGFASTGTLTVSNGGAVSDEYAYVGDDPGGVGNVTVTGSTSTWTNTYSPAIGYLGSGVLTVANGGTVQVGGGTGTLTLAEYSGSHGTLNIGNGGTAGMVQVAEVTGGTGTAAVNFNETGSYTFAPRLTGSLGVTQSGSGTTTLTGANTYNGGTAVNSGALLFGNGSNGSATGTGSLTVASGATIGGAGTSNSSSFAVNGNVVVGNGTDVTSQTTLTATNASTITNANLTFNLGVGATQGESNTLNLGATSVTLSDVTLTLNIVGSGIISYDTSYTLITTSGPINPGAYGLTVGSNGQITGGLSIASNGGFTQSSNGYSGGFYDGSYLAVRGNNIDLIVTPEPTTWAMLVGGLGLLALGCRRRAQS
jgi:T5SS/PEP-CTERM-associated repeat protein/autotransporter-associated beta strand protein